MEDYVLTTLSHYPERIKRPGQPNLVPGKNGVLCPFCTAGLGLPAREWTRDPAVVAAGTKRLEPGVRGTKHPEGAEGV